METCLMENEELNATVGCSNSVDREHPIRTRFVDPQGLPIMKIREGYEIRFLAIPQLNANENRVGIDYTDRLERVIRQLDGDWKQLLAEIQFAFACFLIGQVRLESVSAHTFFWTLMLLTLLPQYFSFHLDFSFLL
ncbi:hypothetical protein OESDEN_21916 [Oesophagostomum dentatum]|uniref:AAR2 C-terminal domain-containing protein n=1 Tax=Oesophagostomum dentatum TaxID=61180 RepID=A0A0B1RZD9_OESDE|nr:hypothetical protein OESDEN_21916 [Oesophagostomum dentatum]